MDAKHASYFLIFAIFCSTVFSTSLLNADTAQTKAAQGEVTLSLRGQLPSGTTPTRAYLFPSPAGVTGILAWTIANNAPHSKMTDAGLYVARLGSRSERWQRRFDLRVARRPFRAAEDYQQGEARGLAVAPDGQSILFGSEPEVHEEYSPDFAIELSELSELDLVTGKSRVLISTLQSRSDFSWSNDEQFLSYRNTEWRFPHEEPGLGLSYEMSYPTVVVDLQTRQFVDKKPADNHEFGHETQWTRGDVTVQIVVEADEYSRPGEQRTAQVTISNNRIRAAQNAFSLLGALVEKTHSYQVRQIIEPLGLSSDTRYLFVRYGQSDALKNQYGPLQITDQGLFAIDLDARRAYLLASFKDVDEVAWRLR